MLSRSERKELLEMVKVASQHFAELKDKPVESGHKAVKPVPETHVPHMVHEVHNVPVKEDDGQLPPPHLMHSRAPAHIAARMGMVAGHMTTKKANMGVNLADPAVLSALLGAGIGARTGIGFGELRGRLAGTEESHRRRGKVNETPGAVADRILAEEGKQGLIGGLAGAGVGGLGGYGIYKLLHHLLANQDTSAGPTITRLMPHFE
jgi:hypothetical protein